MTFSNYCWLLVRWFFMFLFLMLVFQIFADIVNDEALGGAGKAMWIVLLILFTPITVLVTSSRAGAAWAGVRSARLSRGRRPRTTTSAVSLTGPLRPTRSQRRRGLLDNGSITLVKLDQLRAQALA